MGKPLPQRSRPHQGRWYSGFEDEGWDIAPDGKHFAMLRVGPDAEPQLRVITGSLPKLERLVPSK